LCIAPVLNKDVNKDACLHFFARPETKIAPEKVSDTDAPGYKKYFLASKTPGQDGTGFVVVTSCLIYHSFLLTITRCDRVFTKIAPLSVAYGIGVSQHDQEGRTITLEFEKFYLVNCYVPNAGEKLKKFVFCAW
jgi:exodeoxyribonuclease-3